MYVLLTMVFIFYFLDHLYSQSYTIKPVISPNDELIAGTGIKRNIISLSMNNRGDIVFYVILKDNSKSIFLYSNGLTRLLVKTVFAQTLNENEFLFVGIPDINDNGEIVFYGNLSGKSGIYKILDNNISPVIIESDTINGLETTFDNILLPTAPSINKKGEIAFFSQLSDGKEGIFLFSQGITNPVLIEGDQFDILNKTVTLDSVSRPIINDKGEIVFVGGGNFSTEISTKFKDVGVFLYRNGRIIPVKLPGQEAPGTSGKVFSQFIFNDVRLGNNSEVLYYTDYLAPGIEQPPGFLPDISELVCFYGPKKKQDPLH